jgi:hypothetical protein
MTSTCIAADAGGSGVIEKPLRSSPGGTLFKGRLSQPKMPGSSLRINLTSWN